MVYEIAQIEVKEGHEADFEAGARLAVPLFQRAKGCRSMRIDRSVEKPQHYTLVVEWETIENHMVDFRESADFQEWRKLVGPHFAVPPQVEHMHTVLTGF